MSIYFNILSELPEILLGFPTAMTKHTEQDCSRKEQWQKYQMDTVP